MRWMTGLVLPAMLFALLALGCGSSSRPPGSTSSALPRSGPTPLPRPPAPPPPPPRK